MERIVFVAGVNPKAKPRWRWGRGHGYPNPNGVSWSDSFNIYANRYAPLAPFDGPVRVDILAALPRPAWLKGRLVRTGAMKFLRKWLWAAGDGSGLVFCPTKPDKDNLDKAVYDALSHSGLWWTDDALVVAGESIKAYVELGGRPRVVVSIRPLGPEDHPDELASKLGLLGPFSSVRTAPTELP